MVTLADVTCTSKTTDALLEKLKAYGVARIPGFLTPEEAQSAMAEAREATSTMPNYRNPYGPCCRFSLEDLPPHLARSRDMLGSNGVTRLPSQFKRSRNILGGDFFRTATKTYLGPACGFMEVVAFTKDCIPDPRAVYGKLHYDRRHQLKFILYLNDVNEANGAFGCIPGSHVLGRSLYHSGWRKVLQLKTENSAEIERAAAGVPEDQPEYRLVPCVLENETTIGEFIPRRDKLSVDGAAGTLVAFDTHLLHYGGFVAEQTERWTLKGHTFAIAAPALDS